MGEIYRYLGGQEWEYLGQPFGNTQVHCLEVYRGDLWAGTWPQGYILRYSHGQTWEDCGIVGESHQRTVEPINEINDLTVHNGSFFAGVIPRGEVYRYEGRRQWSVVRRLLANPDYNPHELDSWARVPSLTAFGGKLYAGTGTCRGCPQETPHYEAGRVYSTQIGRAVSWDRDMGSGWKHVVAVREQDQLRLYLDGHQVAQSASFAAGVLQPRHSRALLHWLWLRGLLFWGYGRGTDVQPGAHGRGRGDPCPVGGGRNRPRAPAILLY